MGTVISQTQSWELEYGLGKPGEYTVPLEEVMFPPQGTVGRKHEHVSAGDHRPPENSDDFVMKSQLLAQIILSKEIRAGGERRWG